MDKPIFEVISTALAMILLMFMFTLIDSSSNTAQLLTNQVNGLEKVKYDTTIDNVTTPGAVVKGQDIVGAIRYYKSTPNTILEITGFGSTVRYGTCSGCVNKVFSISDFPGAGSDLNFYKSTFSVVNSSSGTGQKWTYALK